MRLWQTDDWTQLMISKMITDNLKLGLGSNRICEHSDVAAAIASEVVDAAGNDDRRDG